MNNFIVGIDGGSCSGKTTLANYLKDELGAVIIHRDNYYLSRDDIPFEERKKINYDCPQAFENDLLVNHLNKLKNGESILSPIYDYSVHNRKKETVKIDPSELIIVDGILLFENELLRSCFDLKVFIESTSETRLKRRISRDTVSRGRTAEDIKAQYFETVEPMYRLYIEPSKNSADMIITGNDFALVKEKIRNSLRERAKK